MYRYLARTTLMAQRALLDLFFPPHCVTCGRLGESFCAACRSNVEFLVPPLCERCGRPLDSATCPYTHEELVIDGIRSVAVFDGAMRQAIHCFKYQRRRELAIPFGQMLTNYLTEHPIPVDVLVPVPLHTSREHWRGYNQAVLLAREIALQGTLSLWYNVIERTRATPPQVGLDTRARHDNVRDAFKASESVAGARILLIDDVCTTGATMNACAVSFFERGAKSVWGLALARPRFPD